MSRERWVTALPAALLVAVAGVQIALAHTAHLSPWLGGGFGMFSTTDTWMSRHVHAFALRGSVRREVPVPADAFREQMRAAAFPARGSLRALARRVAAIPSRDEGPLEAIEIQVWGVRYGSGLEPSGVLLGGARIEPGEL